MPKTDEPLGAELPILSEDFVEQQGHQEHSGREKLVVFLLQLVTTKEGA